MLSPAAFKAEIKVQIHEAPRIRAGTGLKPPTFEEKWPATLPKPKNVMEFGTLQCNHKGFQKTSRNSLRVGPPG